MSVEAVAKRRIGIGGNRGLEARVSVLESEMATMKTDMQIVKDNTSEILSFITATKGVGAFAKKHGPRAMAFVFGIAASAGFVDPKVGAFVRSFFGW